MEGGAATALLVMGPLVRSVVGLVKREPASSGGSFLQQLDRLLIDRPRLAD